MKQIPLPANQQIRCHLGIPDDADRVLIFSESSHWDPNWLFTAEEYFERFVRRNLDQAVEELLKESRRVYSIECTFFLRQYWDHCPEQRDIVRELVNEGRLRLTSSGVNTADTLLPSTEAILRDFLLGQEQLQQSGCCQASLLWSGCCF
jgi:alpha-mannosidase